MADDDGRRRLGRRVVRRREELGLDRKTVAAESGLSYPYVAQIENGEREPSLRAMQSLADALALPLSELTDAVSSPAPSAMPMSAPAPGAYHPNPQFGAAAGSAAPKKAKRSQMAERAMPDMAMEMSIDASPETPSRSNSSSRRRYVVVQIMDVLEQLPARERLAALTDAQAQVLQDVVDDEVRRRA